jgi:hypothetical protein
VGRPSLFTEDRREAFLTATRLGTSRDLAASAAGWSRSAAFAYLERGRAARDLTRIPARDRSFVEFVDAVEKAEATMVQAALAQIVRAAQMPQHWTAAAWLLERRFPETYGRRSVEVTGKDGGPIPVEVTASELLAQLRRVAEDEDKVEDHRRRLRVVSPEVIAGNGHDPEGCP